MPVYDKLTPRYYGEQIGYYTTNKITHPTLGPIEFGDVIELNDDESFYKVFTISLDNKEGEVVELDNINNWDIALKNRFEQILWRKINQIKHVFRPTLKEADQMMPRGDAAASFKLKSPFKRDKKRTKQQVQFDIDNIEEFLKNQPDLDREMATEKRRQLLDLKQELLMAKARLYLENTQGDVEAAAHLLAAASSNLL